MAESLWPILLSLGLLAEGRTLGEICLDLNRRTIELGDGDPPRMLLGDPEVAFPATRPAGQPVPGHQGVVRLAPGVTHLELPSRQPNLVTVEPVNPDQPSGTVMFCQVPGSSSLLAVHHGGAATGFRMRATPADADERFVAL